MVEADMDDSVTEMQEEFSDIMVQNELLAKENRLFDSYLHRKLASSGGEPALRMFEQQLTRQGRRAQLDQSQLTQFQKYTIASQEREYRTKQLKALEEKASEDISLLKAITEGIKIRINEMRKETYEFKRDIIIGGENQRTGTIMAERVVRYFEEKVKQKTALIEKIKLKNAAMKNHRGKMDAQVKHKEEQGDSLHSIDFHQLQIKNSQFNQKINERNTELLKLKMTTGKTVQVLNTAKRNLYDLLAEQQKLRQDIKDRQDSLVKLTDELSKVELEVRKERKKNKKYKIQQSNPDMPQVLDYVNQKSSMYDLEAQVRNWERKVEIMAMAARRSKKFLRTMSMREELRENMSGRPDRPGTGPSYSGGGMTQTQPMFPKIPA